MTAQVSPPRVPADLKPPATEVVLLRALGKGKQIYACQASTDNKFEWALERPQADLLDEQDKKIGKHYEGPTWEAADGSKIIGEVMQRAKAPRSDAVPWLLLKTKVAQNTGTFKGVTYIQRVDTVGGAAPAGGCDRAHVGKEVAIDYQADYYFYASRQ